MIAPRAGRRAAALCAACCALAGCQDSNSVATTSTGSPNKSAAPTVVRENRAAQPRPAVAAAELISAHNARVARLSRLWARASTEVFYNDDGKRHWEQGEGVFQFLAPSRLALTVGKAGEVILYLGCDAERYWLFEPVKAERASVGRHENVGQPCSRALGIPANPLDVIDLLGLSPLRPEAASSVAVSGDGASILLSQPARVGVICVSFDAATREPKRIELLAASEGGAPTVVVAADLLDYETITLRGSGELPPRIPTRVLMRHIDSDTEIRLHLADATNGKPGQLSDEAFNFESIFDAKSPALIVVLDRDCPTPALQPSWLQERGVLAR